METNEAKFINVVWSRAVRGRENDFFGTVHLILSISQEGREVCLGNNDFSENGILTIAASSITSPYSYWCTICQFEIITIVKENHLLIWKTFCQGTPRKEFLNKIHSTIGEV